MLHSGEVDLLQLLLIQRRRSRHRFFLYPSPYAPLPPPTLHHVLQPLVRVQRVRPHEQRGSGPSPTPVISNLASSCIFSHRSSSFSCSSCSCSCSSFCSIFSRTIAFGFRESALGLVMAALEAWKQVAIVKFAEIRE
ncbi:uncharacterized protein G2W53_032776 [Senna tora]|uniref:Uncharacterized protein n=1 Tax=Senna tora TaxID=362788 RepID=A0A834SZL0_9FABA|nr:uncharacterized protein G2W53_032776 [Senna tora]